MRILTFGYDSGLIDTTATPSIQDYARALFDSLSGERTGDNVSEQQGYTCMCCGIRRLTNDLRSGTVPSFS